MSNQSRLPFISIIILNFNGKEYVKRCLSSVLKSEYSNFEVIFVDNASTDESLAAVRDAFGNEKRLKIVRNKKNLGFSGGNNVGFEHAVGNYIVFLNNDTIVEPNWLTSLVNAMLDDPSIGLASSMILQYNGENIASAGMLFSDFFCINSLLEKDFPLLLLSLPFLKCLLHVELQ